MVLEIQLFREDFGGDPEFLKESQKRRYQPPDDVDEVIESDTIWRSAKYELDQANASVNAINREMAKRHKNKEPMEDVIEQRKALTTKIETLTKNSREAQKAAKSKLSKIGNIVHQTVPVSNDPKDSTVVKTVGNITKDKDSNNNNNTHNVKSYIEILEAIEAYDGVRGDKVSGTSGYFLTGIGVLLNYAIQRFALDFLSKRECTVLQTPYFMNHSQTQELTQSRDSSLYGVYTHDNEVQFNLLSSSRHAIAAYHQSEWIEARDLPKKYATVATYFNYAKDRPTNNLLQTNQFEMIEHFSITAPEKSWAALESMQLIAEEFYTQLELPFRVITTVSGQLQLEESKKHEIQVYFPHDDAFKELSSCANLTDYLSRNMEIRYSSKKQGTSMKKYVHMVSNSLCNSEKTICALLENHQTQDGVKIPSVLVPYLNGLDFIPYVKK